ncbi:hypothetical protein [Candidatus Protochlamydia phocaeensis]|uniref:hypothetical protein n=1 Tax=Candidatus Protochlamydia phocaeensis TaxID=1414722 RepID=UPI000AFFF595|nr:hypothetical protein [Candidatus Protochlamydia phocaeensis]
MDTQHNFNVMNAIERRALYNLLRMNWLNDPKMSVEPWQVEDYRALSLPTLFERLKRLSVQLDRTSFIAYADECDSPEDLTEQLVGDRQLKAEAEDQIYLLIFELWRRLMAEKPSLSIFCNELDHQIYLYDNSELENPSELHDALANFILILDENADEGIPSKEVFKLISTYCANDIETFLYDFISEQIDEDHESYAQDLLDGFNSYLEGNKWFDLLRARLLGHSNRKTANKLFTQIIEEHLEDSDLEFKLELLSLMAEIGDKQQFTLVLQHLIGLLQSEEDFQDLLHICLDYFHRLDQEDQESRIQPILKKRQSLSLKLPFNPQDSGLKALLEIFEL